MSVPVTALVYERVWAWEALGVQLEVTYEMTDADEGPVPILALCHPERLSADDRTFLLYHHDAVTEAVRGFDASVRH